MRAVPNEWHLRLTSAPHTCMCSCTHTSTHIYAHRHVVGRHRSWCFLISKVQMSTHQPVQDWIELLRTQWKSRLGRIEKPRQMSFWSPPTKEEKNLRDWKAISILACVCPEKAGSRRSYCKGRQQKPHPWGWMTHFKMEKGAFMDKVGGQMRKAVIVGCYGCLPRCTATVGLCEKKCSLTCYGNQTGKTVGRQKMPMMNQAWALHSRV